MPAALPMLPEVSESVDPPARPLRLSSCPADTPPEARVRASAIPARTVFMTLAPEFRGPEGINLRVLDGCMRPGAAAAFLPVMLGRSIRDRSRPCPAFAPLPSHSSSEPQQPLQEPLQQRRPLWEPL